MRNLIEKTISHMPKIPRTNYNNNIDIPDQTEIDNILTPLVNTENDTEVIDYKKLIWVGELELAIILKLLENYNYCSQTQKHSGGTFKIIYRYIYSKNSNTVEIPKKPALTLKTIKKRTDFYVSYEELPLSMELDFEKIKYKNRTPKWRWLGNPKDHKDLTRLASYITEIFKTPLDLNEF